jgi:hypothetical protein
MIRPPKPTSGSNLKISVSHCFFPGKALEDLELMGDEEKRLCLKEIERSVW